MADKDSHTLCEFPGCNISEDGVCAAHKIEVERREFQRRDMDKLADALASLVTKFDSFLEKYQEHKSRVDNHITATRIIVIILSFIYVAPFIWIASIKTDITKHIYTHTSKTDKRHEIHVAEQSKENEQIVLRVVNLESRVNSMEMAVGIYEARAEVLMNDIKELTDEVKQLVRNQQRRSNQ